MLRNRVFRSVLLAAGVLLMAACASQPASTIASTAVPGTAPAANTLLEKKFQVAAKHYQKFERDGKTMYCKKDVGAPSRMPYTQCLSESQLRLEVESFERWRNPVERPLHASVN